MQKKFFGLGVDKCFVIYPRPVQKTFSAFVLKKNMGGLGSGSNHRLRDLPPNALPLSYESWIEFWPNSLFK